MNNQEAGVLCCWRCRKYIANSGFFAKCNGKKTSKISQPSAAAQNSCNVWHVSLEAIPEWVKCLIEKAQWTIGKLHCPFCEACLGGFNFVCNKECSCGQLVNIHFFKTWTENPVKLSKSSEKHLLLKIQSGFNKDTCHEVVTATLEIINQGLSYTAGSNNGAGRLTEVLCLEERAPRYKIESKKLPLKALNQKRNLPSSYLIKDTCTAKPFHRRSCSLDLNIRERLVLSSVLYETCSMGTLYCGQNENPSAYVQGSLQLESSRKDGSSFQYLYSSRADILQNKFQVTSVTTLLHGDTESECDFEVTGQCSGSVIADGSPFVMNLSLPARAVEDKQYITPGGLAQPMSISFNQKLSKRERNKSKSLRRKRRRREQCLQKQPANDNLHTNDEHELRGDKESYLCAVCLDVYFNPYMCYPCHHIFCEPCLRMLAKDNPASTPCPLCRTTIARVFFQTDLNNSTRSFFPMEYLNLMENFQKSNSAKWPLPSCKKAFRVFEAGFQRHPNTVTRRHFPHAAHRMDYMDFEDDSRGWRFDMDMHYNYEMCTLLWGIPGHR
ncbi:E3 ubiquitin-protein ligase RNF180 isoform X1 [Vidua macroura]|uniref:E3 ubiquitin-protein ligase RNF180 isoform X1 n=1 Tax=Vidua macroura TaxID=187451 RepID=UPI0023A8CE4F|nr:E3 ubiquitin-protein ligase RNF180 isoform X1 [Vidua macroura]XP_053859490.1 E3 ubiquitin-protein ligase RNF180 isoform X1 [Vidua macroura]